MTVVNSGQEIRNRMKLLNEVNEVISLAREFSATEVVLLGKIR